MPNNQFTLNMVGGLSSITMALCYISLFVLFGAVIEWPQDAEKIEVISFMHQNRMLLDIAYGVGYLLFGVVLCITVQAAHAMLSDPKSAMLNTASIFGIIWVMLVLAAGMIRLLSFESMYALYETQPEQAINMLNISNVIVDGLGGGIELAGGVWVFLLSLVGLRRGQAKGLNYLGLVVGMFGMLTVLHTVPYLKELFGLSQIVWFIWLGVFLMKDSSVNVSTN